MAEVDKANCRQIELPPNTTIEKCEEGVCAELPAEKLQVCTEPDSYAKGNGDSQGKGDAGKFKPEAQRGALGYFKDPSFQLRKPRLLEEPKPSEEQPKPRPHAKPQVAKHQPRRATIGNYVKPKSGDPNGPIQEQKDRYMDYSARKIFKNNIISQLRYVADQTCREYSQDGEGRPDVRVSFRIIVNNDGRAQSVAEMPYGYIPEKGGNDFVEKMRTQLSQTNFPAAWFWPTKPKGYEVRVHYFSGENKFEHKLIIDEPEKK